MESLIGFDEQIDDKQIGPKSRTRRDLCDKNVENWADAGLSL